jgi:dihydroorotate dehydrogenase
MGGVASGEDVVELLSVGAGAVALGTVLFSDPCAPGRIRAEVGTDEVTPRQAVHVIGRRSTSAVEL